MSAHQPDLLGIDAARVVPEIKMVLVGELRRDAELRHSPDGKHAHLFVEIVQPPHDGHSRAPIAAVHSAHEFDLPALQLLAARLKAGRQVMLICRGLDFDPQRQELRAYRCDRVTTIAPPAPSEPPFFMTDHQLEYPAAHMERNASSPRNAGGATGA